MNDHPAPISLGGLAAALISLLGPLAGEYLTIVFCSFVGAMWSLSGRETNAAAPRFDGARFMLRMILTAVVFSSSAAWLIERYSGWPAHHVLAGVAFFIAFVGDRWRPLAGDIVAAFRRKLGGNAP
ncbi:hypothetical protein [Rubrivivax rivuli]|uniref:Uncharacterized protein n=1 Tax=Rubrivivax rivuli TaxID=1862385 RepID=A0A437RF01_9BURK|nr:hypothetical protein [Rubrivivax rivuli]RVU45335.1 hypothetical protein EOE66_14505 [Rubrivivax rivuli]